jgi:hypothetical protein
MKRYVSLFTKKNEDLLKTQYLERKEHKTSTCSNILFDPLLEAVLIPKVFLNISNQENIKEQLSNNQEIMAYAWQAVEELRYRFGNDKEILEHIKKYDLMFFRHSAILSAYYSLFEKDDPILKKFYKYMYLYLEG